MKKSVDGVVGIVVAVSMLVGPVLVDAQESNPPMFVKGKFAVPINLDDVKKDWTARGYSSPKVELYTQGWSRDEHTHSVSLIMTLMTGRMEFTFSGQRFVLEPGDELSYAANTVHAARNAHDGSTEMVESFKRP